MAIKCRGLCNNNKHERRVRPCGCPWRLWRRRHEDVSRRIFWRQWRNCHRTPPQMEWNHRAWRRSSTMVRWRTTQNCIVRIDEEWQQTACIWLQRITTTRTERTDHSKSQPSKRQSRTPCVYPGSILKRSLADRKTWKTRPAVWIRLSVSE